MLNKLILRRILGIGRRSGVAQLYSELGVYPLRVRRLELALRYLRYLVGLPASHYAYIAAVEADKLRREHHSSWMGDLALVLGAMPFTMPPLPCFSELTTAACDSLVDLLRTRTRHWVWMTIEDMVSLPLLHRRLEPKENGDSSLNKLCRRHYLSRVPVTDHRLALTRLLCGSFYFRGVHNDLDLFSFDQICCRQCQQAVETPGHVFMVCRAEGTVEARRDLRQTLMREHGHALVRVSTSDAAEDLMRTLIFDWNTVVPMARFIYKVARYCEWFGRRSLTRTSQLVPDFDGADSEAGFAGSDSGTEEGSFDGGMMEIDF